MTAKRSKRKTRDRSPKNGGKRSSAPPSKSSVEEWLWGHVPLVLQVPGRRDKAFEPFLAGLPHQLADEILHREALADLVEIVGVSKDQRSEFDRRIKIALEQFIRNYRIVQSSPRVQRDAARLLKQIYGVAERLRDLLNRVVEGDAFLRKPKSPHLKEILALDLMRLYGRRLPGDDWLSRIDGDLSMILRIVRFAVRVVPHGNRNFAFDALILDLADIYREYSAKPPRKNNSAEPTDGFWELVDNLFFSLRTWGTEHYGGSTYAGKRSLRSRIRRAFASDDALHDRLTLTLNTF